MKNLLIGIAILALLALGFRHFVTNSITDIGGMENPEYSQSEN